MARRICSDATAEAPKHIW